MILLLLIAVVIVTMADRRVMRRTILTLVAVAMLVEGQHRRSRAIAEIADTAPERKNPRERHEGEGGENALDEGRFHEQMDAQGKDFGVQPIFRMRPGSRSFDKKHLPWPSRQSADSDHGHETDFESRPWDDCDDGDPAIENASVIWLHGVSRKIHSQIQDDPGDRRGGGVVMAGGRHW